MYVYIFKEISKHHNHKEINAFKESEEAHTN